MKTFSKISVFVLVFAFALNLTGMMTAQAATAPALGAASSFAVLAGSGIVSTNPPQVIIGDAGSDPTVSNGLTGVEVTGINYTAADAAVIAAKVALANAYADASTQPQSGADIASDLAAQNLMPGVYHSAAGTFTISGAGTLTLDGGGDPNAIFIFKADTTLITGGASSVVLTNGARAQNVFWTVGTSATLDNTTFVGTIMAEASITDTGNSTVNGRLFADAENNGTGAVTLNNTEVTAPTSLTLVKAVTNNSGGSATTTDWTLSAAGPTPISGVTGSSTITSATVDSGIYTLSETGPAGYTSSSWSCTNGITVNGSSQITLTAGVDTICTITNDDIAVVTQLTVTKVVVNDNGRTNVIADFPLFVSGTPVTSGVANAFSPGTYTVTETPNSNYTSVIAGDCAANGTITLAPGDNKICTITNNDTAPATGGSSNYTPPVPPIISVVKVPSPLALPGGAGSVTYTYTLRNIGTVPVTDVTMVDNSCSPLVLNSGDANSDSKLDVTETWIYTCSTTLSETHTNTVVATGWANGISATDIASATVVVGLPVVPPLINVTKVPSPLTLPAGGGAVTYTNKVTNPGTVALSNVRVTDNKCGSVNYVSGDVNGDSKLDTFETWTYNCRANLTGTITNTVTASGEANGLTAMDFAIATVVVAAAPAPAPALPDTGSPFAGINFSIIAMIAGIIMLASISLVIFLRKFNI